MNDFVKLSKYAGMREDLVQAGGGNSSYKEASDRMLIKASGYQLADVSETRGFSVVNPQIIKSAFIAGGDTITEADSKEILKDAVLLGEKPSIETFLHSVTGTYTLHTHPTVVNALTCRKGGMEELASLFPEAVIIPYATPGVELAKIFFREYKKQAKNGKIIFLQNHGLVVSGETANEVISETERVTTEIEKVLGADMKAYHDLTALWETYFSEKILWKVTDENISRTSSTWPHTFCPDCVVFLGKKFLSLEGSLHEQEQIIDDFIASNGEPVVIIYNDVMYIQADNVKKALEIQSVLSFSAQVMKINKNFECNFLSEQEQNFLLNWDAEKYRKKWNS